MKTISVLGLGYVGFNVARLCAESGYKVYGIDVDKKKIDAINESPDIIATDNPSVIKDSDVIIICVGTPINSRREPDLEAVKSASRNISKYLQKGQLVIIESSLYPGVTENIIKPVLEESDLKAGKDFLLAYCPERVDPGNKKWTIKNIPRVLGGINDESTRKALEFYKSILDANIHTVSSIKTVELIKIVENSFRDVNIAFVNELAKSCAKQNIDVMEVIEGASTKPFGFMPHKPGCGVGGLCIPVSPYYIIESGRQVDFEHSFLKLARDINDSMPSYTVSLLIDALNKIGKCVKNSKIAILGVSYKAGIGDLKGSPYFKILRELAKRGAAASIFDPYLPEESTVKTIEDALEGADCVLLVTEHPEFKQIPLIKFKNNGIKIIIDGRNIYNKKEAEELGIIYKGIGR